MTKGVFAPGRRAKSGRAEAEHSGLQMEVGSMTLELDYLEKGLTCMSRSMAKSVWPAHFGAALIAAYYFVRENDLSPETIEAICAQADRYDREARYVFRAVGG